MESGIRPFEAMRISRRAGELARAGRSVIAMHFGQPSTGAPAAARARAHEVLDTDPMGYLESAELKARIARHYAETQGVTVPPDRIILTCGASPALVLAMNSAFVPGDRIAFARPGYIAYRNNALALGLMPVDVPCGPDERYQLTAAAIAALDPAPAGIIIASPANPTGTIIADAELADIARVCQERGIRIVSDEIYHGITFAGPAGSILRHTPDALVVNSFSKYFSMVGWRLGWLVAPDDLLFAARARMGNLFLTAPSLSQHAGLVAMDCTGELEGHVATYARNRALLLDALPGLGLTKFAPPDGAFYFWCDVSHLTDDSMALCETILEQTGVALAPGIDFDWVDGRQWLRISFAVSTREVEDAIVRLRAFLGR